MKPKKKKIPKNLTSVWFVLLLSISVAFAQELPESLIPVGRSVGIRLHTDGVMVAEVNSVETAQGTVHPAKEAGLQVGDLILSVDGKTISSNEELQQAIALSGGKPLVVQIRRDGVEQELTIAPVRAKVGGYRLGVLIRDSMSGIGTLTFVDPETGQYGSLGHGICDSKSGTLLPLGEGSLIGAEVERVQKGEAGEPGALQGKFDADAELGTVVKNTTSGIFGVLQDQELIEGLAATELVPAEEVKVGDCKILSNVTGTEVCAYDAQITKIFDEGGELDQCVMLHITDPSLLHLTGGIVQGMSGSPIIQDGKLVGAVTHVLVNDPTRGYGIFIQNMLDAAG